MDLIFGRAIGSGGISGVCSTTSRKRLLLLTMYSRRASTASSCERLSIVPHKVEGLRRKDSELSNIARSFGIRCSARCRCPAGSQRYLTPHLKQHRQQTKAPLRAHAAPPAHAARRSGNQTETKTAPRYREICAAIDSHRLCSTLPGAHDEFRRLRGDDAQRPQTRSGSGRQVVDEAAVFTHKRLDSL